MNSLSWMIYLADVADAANGALIALCVIGVGAGGITLVVLIDEGKEDVATIKRIAFKAVAAIAATITLIVAIPDDETVYAIAASEMGESALNTETGGKAVKALNAWLDRQIAGESASND